MFAVKDLERECSEGVYEEVRSEEAHAIARRGVVILSTLMVWQGHGGERNGRVVVNFKRQSMH